MLIGYVCEERRLLSDCAYAQSDQGIRGSDLRKTSVDFHFTVLKTFYLKENAVFLNLFLVYFSSLNPRQYGNGDPRKRNRNISRTTKTRTSLSVGTIISGSTVFTICILQGQYIGDAKCKSPGPFARMRKRAIWPR